MKLHNYYTFYFEACQYAQKEIQEKNEIYRYTGNSKRKIYRHRLEKPIPT